MWLIRAMHILVRKVLNAQVKRKESEAKVKGSNPSVWTSLKNGGVRKSKLTLIQSKILLSLFHHICRSTLQSHQCIGWKMSREAKTGTKQDLNWNSLLEQTLSVSLLCGLMRKLARKKSISSSMSSLRNGAPRENGLSALREKINRNFKPKEQRDLSKIHRYD